MPIHRLPNSCLLLWRHGVVGPGCVELATSVEKLHETGKPCRNRSEVAARWRQRRHDAATSPAAMNFFMLNFPLMRKRVEHERNRRKRNLVL